MKKAIRLLIVLILCLPVCFLAFACKASGTDLPAQESVPTAAPAATAASEATAAPEVSAEKTPLGAFSTKDFNGNSVTQAVLADYKLTMVNVWGTYCGPCIYEMPYLGELYKRLPEGVNLLGICTDAQFELDAGKQIMADAGCEFVSLIPDEGIGYGLLDPYIEYIPTTLFVDGSGGIVGELHVGAPRGDIVEGYLALINDALASLS